ncbi:MAG: hypothetical protein CMJ50_05480 [Planctomycetaceae bacterium]|nr:hypothetical protein [Planctomycetaceae bacterium]
MTFEPSEPPLDKRSPRLDNDDGIQRPQGDRDPVETLIDEFTERYRRGEHPSMDEYAERYPELAEEIRDLFPAAVAIENLKVRKELSSGGQVSLRGVRLERLGDFRIIREIGRGGMGIVYEAEQESLGRRVALKVLPKQALLDEKHLLRFRREAKTAGRLHHTNIVPVFGVACDDGYHYYVMQLIDGVSLDQWGKPLPPPRVHEETRIGAGDTTPEPMSLPPFSDAEQSFPDTSTAKYTARDADVRHVADIGIQAAAALDFAHKHGVLHRDVKPANLILDPEGTVWVTDFGLAKFLEQDNVTRSGDVVGTLRYMAPEHLTGGRIDARSDIYSLGITLHELLTGQLALGDLPQGRLVEKIVAGDVARLRKLNPAVPRDLETIILKAIACEPGDRYQSAGDLAADLRRFLEDKPLLARRTTAAEHVWRWCRRNRLVAGLAVTALSLLVLVAVATTVGYLHTKAALDGERVERARAESATDVGLEVLDNIYEQFAPEPFDPFAVLIAENTDSSGQREPSLRPALSPDTAALLESMLAFYDRLAEQNGNDSRFRRKAAQAKRRGGDIRQHLQQFDQAAAAYREAISIYQQLDETSDDPTIALETAQIHNEIGHMYPYIGQPEEAIQSHQKAVQILESTRGEKYYPETRYELARAYFLLGRQGLWGATIGTPDGPHKLDDMPLRQGSGPNPHLRPDGPPPKRIPSRKALGGSLPPPKHDPWPAAADSLSSEEDTKQRLRNLHKAIDVLRDLVRQPTHAPEHAALLAFVYHRAGVLEELTGNLDEAQASFDEAVSVQSDLVDRFPETANYQLVLEQYQQPLADRRRIHDGPRRPPGGPRRFGPGQRHRHEPTGPPGQFRPPPPP